MKDGLKKSYLQSFPFSKLSDTDKTYLLSEDFFLQYIKSGAFILYPESLHRTENYIQKGDGSFRDSSLVSPMLYLVLQSIGKEISNKYISQRPPEISVYYAGNYQHNRPIYKQDYDDFFKEINEYIDSYQYFIKTDISNFYSNINFEKLVQQLDYQCNTPATTITQTQLLLYRKLLEYCGAGNFPLIENSIASSYLSTIVYLDKVDVELYDYIQKYIKEFNEFKIIRYVDDMYILISSDKPISCLYQAFNEIRNEYSSILKKYGLALNAQKCSLKPSVEINNELKKSLYDEYFNGKKCHIEELFENKLLDFITDLTGELSQGCTTIERYNKIIHNHFYLDDVEFTPNEVFNYLIYENCDELTSPEVIDAITKLVNCDVSFINLDSKRLTVMIMKTKSTGAIKTMLNQLFQKNRIGKWNSYDTTIAISYLIQSRFNHIDLLSTIKIRVPELYLYYEKYCKVSFVESFKNEQYQLLSKIINGDTKSYFLYFMYCCEEQKNDYLTSFAFYKNYFDRISAQIAFYIKYDDKAKKPNYKGFYTESALKKLYVNIENSDTIINDAHSLRNSNPVSHASADLLDSNETSKNISEAINSLDYLIKTLANS